MLNTELTFAHYKEPLMEIPKGKGHGYYGAILMSKDCTKMQCHVCGELFESVAAHAWQAHGMRSLEYKEKFQLARKTALISESFRWKLQQKTLDWLKTLTQEQKDEMKQQAKDGLRAYRKDSDSFQPKIALETKNKRGTCPEQILDKIKKVADKLGHTPTKKEFITECGGQRYTHLIYQVYGSWTNALKLVDMKPEYKKNRGGGKIYDDEFLLESLVIFAQENNKIPTFTDFNRGLLPSYDAYIRRWGSIETARREAGVYDFIDPDEPLRLPNGEEHIKHTKTKKSGGQFLSIQ